MIFKNIWKFKCKVRCVKWNLIRNFSTNCQNCFKPRVLFFGVDNFSLYSIKSLFSSFKTNGISKLDVVTSFKAKKNPIREFSFQNELIVYDWNEILQFGIPNEYDMGLVVSFGHLIPGNIIDSFPMGMLNVHASLLPKYRGASPIIYAIRNGESKSGVSIMRIEPHHFDTGEVLAQAEVKIETDMLMPDLHDQLGQIGASLLLDCVLNYEEYSTKSIQQNELEVSYAPKIDSNFCRVSWDSMNSLDIYNLYRSLYSFKQITTNFHDELVKIVELKYDHNQPVSDNKNHLSGSIKYNWKNKSLLVQCIDNKIIEIFKLSVGKKKTMSALDFHNGFLKKCSESERFFK